jgi:hypothetical protein
VLRSYSHTPLSQQHPTDATAHSGPTGLCSARETTSHNPAKSERCSASRPRRQRLPRRSKQRCFVSSQKQATRLRRRVTSSQSRNTLKKTARKLSSRSSLRCGFLSFRFSMFFLSFRFSMFFSFLSFFYVFSFLSFFYVFSFLSFFYVFFFCFLFIFSIEFFCSCFQNASVSPRLCSLLLLPSSRTVVRSRVLSHDDVTHTLLSAASVTTITTAR